MSKVTTLRIDEREIGANEDETILEVALDNGIFIPTLCHLQGLSDVGACRMCVVEVKGVAKPQAACVTQVKDNMEVVTQSERLESYRKTVLEFLFSERNHVCAVCVSNGDCELQWMAHKHEIDHVSVPYRYPSLPVDASHDRFVLDHNRCILCTRCVRVCAEIEGAHTWDVANRGVDAMIVSDLNQPWGDSTSCTSCGKCVQVCPTGALFEKGNSVAEMTKKRQFLPYLTMMREERP